ncbi:isomerase [Lithospermum erythrorhizon]|uniref:Isomerase n=1 Tax=Lithospermum erythrorhizon TaxID=34254 RepID=A0AAV3RFY0_LITER
MRTSIRAAPAFKDHGLFRGRSFSLVINPRKTLVSLTLTTSKKFPDFSVSKFFKSKVSYEFLFCRIDTGPRRLSISCGVKFRPCIDIHKGKVKQIVGSTLQDSQDSTLITNFESDKSAAEYAKLYKDDGLTGGHAIMLGADPLSKAAAIEALHAYPGGLQVGGGVNASNALNFIEEGASHVIVTSVNLDQVYDIRPIIY